MKGERYALPRRFLLARLQGVAVRVRGACREVCRRRVHRLRFRRRLRRLYRQHLHRHGRERPQIPPDDPPRDTDQSRRRRDRHGLFFAASSRFDRVDQGRFLRLGQRPQDESARDRLGSALPPEDRRGERRARSCRGPVRARRDHQSPADKGVRQDRGRLQLPLRLLRHPARKRSRPLQSPVRRAGRGQGAGQIGHARDRAHRDRDRGVRDRPRRLPAGRPDRRRREQNRR